MIWKVLGIEETKDKEMIRKAYLAKLRSVNPEDDAEGFKELRNAYEEALAMASMPEEDKNNTDGINDGRKKNDVDKWIDKITEIYSDMALRRDAAKWRSVLSDPVCDDLDTEIEAGEKLLVFLMSHTYLPQLIWQLIDKRFNYTDNLTSLKEKFPENFLDYVVWQINNQSFFEYDFFDGDTKDRPDEYINKLFEIKNAEERRDVDSIERLLKELDKFDITHPYALVEKANCLLIKAGELPEFELGKSSDTDEEISDEDKIRLNKQALDIMEEVDFEYSANIYIHRIYGEVLVANRKVQEAMKVFDELDEADNSSSAKIGKAKCLILCGDYEQAKEMIEDVLEDKVQDFGALALLDVINAHLTDKYIEVLNDDRNLDTVIKLGWCYYQQREFKKGIKLLDDFDDRKEYDYVNLRCRLYLADDDYEKAYPWACRWLKLIEESVDDGSREMTKRKNRLSLAHFSLGVCLWELSDGKGDDSDKAVSFIRKSIDEESNKLVKLSYMEQLAKFYLSDKQYEKCIDECTTIIEMDQGFFPAYVHRQRANYEMKNAREVIDDYYACIDIYPEYAPPYILAAEVYFAFEQYEDIEHILESANKAGIVSDTLELYRIRLLHYKDFSRENLSKALSAIEKLENKIEDGKDVDGNNPDSDIEKAEDVVREHSLIYWDLDENDQALMILDNYLKYHPNIFALQNLKIDILNQSGKTKDALRLCRQLYNDNQTVYMQTRLGICYERNQDYENARKNYEEAYKKDPEYQVVVRRLMYLYSYLSDKKKDLDLCRKGIFYATEYIKLTETAEGYVERGNLYIDLYELEKAVDDCKRAIELNPEAYYAHNNLGCALLKLRRVGEAISPLEKAIEIDESRDHLPYLNLAEVYTVLGKYDEAIKQYERMLSLFPKHTYVWKDIVGLYCLMGQYDKAIEYYEKEINDAKEEIRNISFWNRNGGSPDNIKKENRLMQLYCDIADVYRQKKEQDKAVSYYDMVLKRLKSLMKPRISMQYIKEIAEYYRDRGEMDKAVKYIKLAYFKMSGYAFDSKAFDDMQFVAMTIFYEAGNQGRAERESIVCYNKFVKKYGSLEKAFEDARYLPSRLYHVGIIKLCSGDIEEAKKYIERIKPCKLCVMCEHAECFEYYFGMGLIAEAEGRYDEAADLYEKAIEIKKDYPCAARHLEIVRSKIKM